MKDLIERISHFLTSNTLPGFDSQAKMSPFHFNNPVPITKTATQAAVLFLIYPNHKGQWCTAYMKRTSFHGADKHKGQISLPGGKLDGSDKNMEACALRETEEEFGISKTSITIAGTLTPLFVFVSDFNVHPFVGYIKETPTFRPDPKEVEEIIEIPLSKLFDVANKKYQTKHFGQKTIHDSPYYMLKSHILWGATAMITAEIEAIYNKIS